jgi:hypothetical protein
MQLGKLDACQSAQELSCKTNNNRAQHDQRLTSEKQNSQQPGLIVQHDGELWSIRSHDDAACSTSHSTALAASSVTQSRDSSFGVGTDNPHAQMRPLDAPNRNESAEGYSYVVAVLNEKWRVIECRDGLQWILQSRDTLRALPTAVWRGRSYCRSKEALLRVSAAHAGAINPTAAAIVTSLPERIATASHEILVPGSAPRAEAFSETATAR